MQKTKTVVGMLDCGSMLSSVSLKRNSIAVLRSFGSQLATVRR